MKDTIFKLDKHARDNIENTLKDLLEICQICHTPMFGCAIIKIDKNIEYNNIVYSSQSHQIRLYDDKIRKHMLVANGFDVTPPVQNKDNPNEEVEENQIKSKKITEYVLEKDQLDEIHNALEKVYALSEKYETAIFASVAIENINGETKYDTKIGIPDSPIFNRGNQISKHQMISEKLFDAIPVRDSLSLDMEEVFSDYGN